MSPDEISRWIEKHSSALTLYARQWSRTPEDLVQDAFLKWIQQKVPPRDHLAWLYQVVRRKAMDEWKTNQRRQLREKKVSLEQDQQNWFCESEVDGLDAQIAVAALQELPIEEREVIIASLWGGLSLRQIADLLECSLSTAQRKLQSGFDRLREKLGEPCKKNSPIH